MNDWLFFSCSLFLLFTPSASMYFHLHKVIRLTLGGQCILHWNMHIAWKVAIERTMHNTHKQEIAKKKIIIIIIIIVLGGGMDVRGNSVIWSVARIQKRRPWFFFFSFSSLDGYRQTSNNSSGLDLVFFYRCEERQFWRVCVHPKETADPKKETEEWWDGMDISTWTEQTLDPKAKGTEQEK